MLANPKNQHPSCILVSLVELILEQEAGGTLEGVVSFQKSNVLNSEYYGVMSTTGAIPPPPPIALGPHDKYLS